MTQSSTSAVSSASNLISRIFPFGTSKPAPKNKIFSFFSGAGFLDLGFEKSGFEVAFVNENCTQFVDAYKYSRKKLGMTEPQFGFSTQSIEDFLGATEISQSLSSWVELTRQEGATVGFIGGPPCPDFSLGGKHKGFEGENGRLTRVYYDLILKHKPDWFLFENVKGLFHTKKHRQFFDELLNDVNQAGYAVSYDLVNSLEFGVPQYRDRILIFGIKKALAGDDVVQPSAFDSDRYGKYSELKSFCPRKYASRDLKDILSLAWPQTNGFSPDSDMPLQEGLLQELTVEHWFKKNNVNTHANAKHHFAPTEGNLRFSTIEEGCAGKKSFKRLHRWRYSPTAAYGNNEVHLHPYKPRRLSAAEALAVQSMPADFVLPPQMPLTYMFKTIGNGVPFLMAKGIASAIRDYLKEAESASD